MCKVCQLRSHEHAATQARWVPVGERELRAFRSAAPGERRLLVRYHADRRQVLRCISDRDIVRVVMTGQVIERYRHGAEIRMLLRADLPLRSGRRRFIHVAVALPCRSLVWAVTTVYDPSIWSWRWDATYSRRTCWCTNDEEEILVGA